MAFGLHPVVFAAIVGGIIAMFAFVMACITRRMAVRICLCILGLLCLAPAALVFVAFYPEIVDARFRAYKGFYQDLHPGMTRAEVFAAMDKHYPAGGVRKRPKIVSDEKDSLSFFMDPENSREPNCEGIFLGLRDGRVKTLEYSRD
jgi:hypothetical protein